MCTYIRFIFKFFHFKIAENGSSSSSSINSAAIILYAAIGVGFFIISGLSYVGYAYKKYKEE